VPAQIPKRFCVPERLRSARLTAQAGRPAHAGRPSVSSPL
jgi:hypothetical protein